MKTAIVIGAGPAGLTAAYSLLENGGGAWRVVVLEASGEIGGLARTVSHGACRIDIGGHRFFSKNAEVNALWAKLMPTQGAPAWDDRALATLWPAAVYRESPLALILQIPEIGKPYLHVTAGTIPNAICALAGEGGVLAWGALCVLACAALSFLTQSAPCWLLRCVPALIVFPVWTYSPPVARGLWEGAVPDSALGATARVRRRLGGALREGLRARLATGQRDPVRQSCRIRQALHRGRPPRVGVGEPRLPGAGVFRPPHAQPAALEPLNAPSPSRAQARVRGRRVARMGTQAAARRILPQTSAGRATVSKAAPP